MARIHASCTLQAMTSAAYNQAAPGLNFVGVAGGVIANKGFRADLATGVIPEATVNTAGVMTAGNSVQSRGVWCLGLLHPIDRTRAQVQVTLSPATSIVAAGTAIFPRKADDLIEVCPMDRWCGFIAGVADTAQGATAADCNVVLCLYAQTSGLPSLADGVGVAAVPSATSGGALIHITVFDLQDDPNL